MPALSPRNAARLAGDVGAASGPFVGPGPFSEADKELFFGRETDVSRVRSLLRTERIIVLHSPSGAGKTSLIQAGLVPRLRQDGVHVFPTVRVGQPLPAPSGANRFAFSAVASLESGFTSEDRKHSGVRTDRELVGIRLSAYFTHRTAMHGRGAGGRLLIFDQFEELFTRSPHDHRARIEFFTDLAKVLRDKSIWALFAMREEYVAALDRYKRLLPAQLAARFHLDLLTADNARLAISGPAGTVQVTVKQDAQDLIINDLAAAAPRRHGAPEEQSGDHPEPDAAVIDPLHLQLLCVDLWQRLPDRTKEVDAKMMRRLRAGEQGGAFDLSAVDRALLRYYDQTLRRVCQQVSGKMSGESGRESTERECHELERRVRFWIDDNLIEANRYRRQAIAEEGDALFRETQTALEDEHILRANVRLGTTWYEIAHDRMVKPLRRSNDSWYNLHHDRFERSARRWHDENYPPRFESLTPKELEDEGYGKSLGRAELAKLPDHERRYLEFCHEQARRKRWRLVVVGLMVAAAAIGALAVWPSYKDASEKAKQAQTDLTKAKTELETVTGQVAEKNRNLTEFEAKQKTVETRGRVRRLYSAAMTQRWRFENHDVALLLTQLALGENSKLSSEDQLPKVQLDSAFWTAIEAKPFSQTVPRKILGGEAVTLTARDHSIYVSVPGAADARRRLARIDTQALRLSYETPCREGSQSLSPDQRLIAVAVGQDLEIVNVEGGRCKPVERQSVDVGLFSPAPPVWSPDQKFVAAFLADGGVAIYRRGVGQPQPEQIPPRPVESAAGDSAEGPYRVTAVAFQNGFLAAGDAGGGVRFIKLLGNSVVPQDFNVWKEAWPYPPPYGHPDSQAEDAEIVAMAFLSLPGAAAGEGLHNPEVGTAIDEAEPWLCLVHRGGQRTKGGKIILHRLAPDAGPGHELIADPASRIRESVLRQLGRSVERPGGEAISSASFAGAGAWLTTAGETGTVTRWDLRHLSFDRVPPSELGHQPPPSGSLETGRSTPGVEISFDVVRGRRDLLRGARGRIATVLATDDGEHVAAIQQDAGVRLWHMERHAVAFRSRSWGRAGYLYALSFDSKNHLITTDNRGRAQSWRLAVATEAGCDDRSTLHEHPMQLCVEADGELETQLNAGILSLDLANDLLILGMGDHVPRLVSRVHPDSARKLVDRLESHKGRISAAVFRPDDGQLAQRFDAATGDRKGRLIFWDLEKRSGGGVAIGESASAIDLTDGITDLVFHPAGRWLVVASKQGQLHLIDMTGRRCGDGSSDNAAERPCVAQVLSVGVGGLRSVAFNDDGDRLAAAGGAISWWRFESESGDPLASGEQRVWGAAGPIFAIAFVPGEVDTLATTAAGSVQLWTLEDNGWPVELHGEGVELLSLAFSRDGNLLAAGDAKGRFMVWDLDIAKYVCSLTLRDLTRDEWDRNVGRLAQRKICSEPSGE